MKTDVNQFRFYGFTMLILKIAYKNRYAMLPGVEQDAR